MASLTAPRSNRGFTLIEIVIVIAILAVLAAVAIPTYQRSFYRARQAESMVILANMRTNQWSYYGLYDCFANTEVHPVGVPSVIPLPWNSARTIYANPCDGMARSFFDLGVELSIADSYFQYECAAGVISGTTEDFTCTGRADLDGDGLFQEILYCTDQTLTGMGLMSPQTGVGCTFPYSAFKITLGSW